MQGRSKSNLNRVRDTNVLNHTRAMSTASRKSVKLMCFSHNQALSMVCKTCGGDAICYTCIRTSHKGHMIAPIKRPKKVGTIGTYCSKHDRKFVFVCETCGKEPLCKTCFYPWHKGHTITDYGDYVKKLRERFLRIETTERKLTVEKVAAEIKKRRDELKDHVDSIADKFAAECMAKEKKSVMKQPKVPEFTKFETNFPDVRKLFGTLK